MASAAGGEAAGPSSWQGRLEALFDQWPAVRVVTEHEELGNHLRCEEALEKGDLVLAALPYAWVVHPEWQQRTCQRCFGPFVPPGEEARELDDRPNPVRCPMCRAVYYCGPRCRSLDASAHFATECAVLRAWSVDSLSEEFRTELRLLLRTLARKTAEAMAIAHCNEEEDRRRRPLGWDLDHRVADYDLLVASPEDLPPSLRESMTYWLARYMHQLRQWALGVLLHQWQQKTLLPAASGKPEGGPPADGADCGSGGAADAQVGEEVEGNGAEGVGEEDGGEDAGADDGGEKVEEDGGGEEVAAAARARAKAVVEALERMRVEETEEYMLRLLCRNRRNSFHFGNGEWESAQGHGVYILPSFFNHSCLPNVQLRTLGVQQTPMSEMLRPQVMELPDEEEEDDDDDSLPATPQWVSNVPGPMLLFFATQRISPGEPLTISYLDNGMTHGVPSSDEEADVDPLDALSDPYNSFARRRAELQESYFFHCCCERCLAQEAASVWIPPAAASSPPSSPPSASPPRVPIAPDLD